MTALRLYDGFHEGETPQPGGEAKLRLRGFFDRYVLCNWLIGRSPDTIKEYYTSIAYWEQFSGDPMLAELDTAEPNERGRPSYPVAREAVARFRHGLVAVAKKRNGEPLEDNTIRKHCQNIQFILDRAGPRSRKIPDAEDLLADVPFIAKPALVVNEVLDMFSLNEFALVLDASRFMSVPHSWIKPAVWWANLLLFMHNTGLRISSVVKLRFDWIVEDELGCWIEIPSKGIKNAEGRKKRGRMFYLNAHAWKCVQRMPRTHAEIFHWPYAASYLQKRRRKLMGKTGLPPKRRLGFKAIRKMFNNELMQINPIIVPLAMGHAGGRNTVTLDFYTHRKRMCEAMDRLPQPDWDPENDSRQLKMF